MHVCVAAYEKVRAAQKYHGTETEVFYFPGLVLWSVRENNYFVFSCAPCTWWACVQLRLPTGGSVFGSPQQPEVGDTSGGPAKGRRSGGCGGRGGGAVGGGGGGVWWRVVTFGGVW